MVTEFRFALPGGALELRPVLRLSRAVDDRKCVLLFDVERPVGMPLDDASFWWSDSLNAQFRYVPATPSARVVRTRAFTVPARAEQLRVRVHMRSGADPAAVDDIALITEIRGEPAIIFAAGVRDD